VIYSSNRNGIKQVFLAYLDGRQPEQLTAKETNSDVLDVSPDGTKILYATARDESDLWSVALDRGRETQLTSDMGIELWPDVAPDGKAVAFQATHATTGSALLNCLLLAKSVTSEEEPTQLAPDGFAPHWSPDGNQIAFLRFAGGMLNLWTVHAGGGDPKPLTTEGVTFGGFTLLPFNRSQTQDFQWSPDSSRLVYCAMRAGLSNVWQIASDGTGARQISDNTDRGLRFFEPIWSPDAQSVAWLVLSTVQGEQKKNTWSIWLSHDGKGQPVFQSDTALGLVGWSPSGHELIVKSVTGVTFAPNRPCDINLIAIPVISGPTRSLAELKDTYFHNIQLAPARNQIAFVTRQNNADTLQVIPATSGATKAVVASNDPRVYLAGLAWSADGKTIYYGKQASWTSFLMLEGFK
jgi:Tol biopolymer transport system component